MTTPTPQPERTTRQIADAIVDKRDDRNARYFNAGGLDDEIAEALDVERTARQQAERERDDQIAFNEKMKVRVRDAEAEVRRLRELLQSASIVVHGYNGLVDTIKGGDTTLSKQLAEQICTAPSTPAQPDPLRSEIDEGAEAPAGRGLSIQNPLRAFAEKCKPVVKSLLDIIHDDLTHARQRDHVEAIDNANKLLGEL